MKHFIKMTSAALALTLVAASPVHALTIKSGQVLGSDGEVYDGASPEQAAILLKQVRDGGESVGVSGSSLFVVINDVITFVPLADLRGKDKDGVKEELIKRLPSGDFTAGFKAGAGKLVDTTDWDEATKVAHEKAVEESIKAFERQVETIANDITDPQKAAEATGSVLISVETHANGDVTETFY